MRLADICKDAIRPSATSGSRYAAAPSVSYHQPLLDVVAGRTGAQSLAPHGMSMHQIRVKNTFVDVVDGTDKPHPGLQRYASDSDMSRSSRSEDDNLRFWVPSLTISSSSHSSALGQGDKEDTVGAQPTDDSVGNSAAQTPLASNQARQYQPVWFEAPEQPSVSKVSTRPQSKRGFAMELETSASQQNRDAPPIVQQFHEETGVPVDLLMDLHIAHDLSLVPRDLSTNMLLSVGSIKHNNANCTPCMFNASRQCQKGISCVFCHFMHPGFKSKRYRPPKKKRDKMKAAANRAEPFQDADSCSDEEGHSQMASSSSTAPIGHLESTFPNANQDLRLGQRVCRMMDEKPNTKMRL